MSRVTFYRWSLLAPLVFPILCFPLRFVGPELGPCYSFATVMALSLVVGALPYLVSLAIVSPLFRSGSNRKVTLAMWLLPVVMSLLIVCFIYAAPFLNVLINGEPGWGRKRTDHTASVVVFLFFTLGIGYSYVIVVQCACWVCWQMGWVQDGTYLKTRRIANRLQRNEFADPSCLLPG